ncbi:hypothetical protein BGX24_012003 [Mortierella sp. AD032]|nr:hypothetical protein BGX24_012003 [Mortierella sp. AD032]
MSHSHPLSRQQSPALDLIPAPTSSGTITLTTTTTVLADLSKRPREYINVAQRKEMRKHGAIRDTSYWNTLLIAARKSRGPYLCPSTRTYHVDRTSKLYWSGYNDEPETPDASIPTVTVGQEGANVGTENGPPGSMAEANVAEQGANGDIGAGSSLRTGTPTPGPANASAPASAGGVPSTPTGPEIKEESNVPNPNGSLAASNGSLNSALTSTPKQNSNLTSPTLNPALMNRPLPNRGNPLMSPTQQGSVFTQQLSNPVLGQGMQQPPSSQPQQQQQQPPQQQQQHPQQTQQQQQSHPQLLQQQQQQLQHQQQLQQQQQQLQQQQQQQQQQPGQGINPMMVSQPMGGMPAGMMAGGFVSPDSLMQQMPVGSMPGQMSMVMPQGYVNMGQMHPQMMQHLQAQQQQNPQQMYAQQQHILQQQFLQQQAQQQQAQQQQMMQGQQDFQGPPRPKGRPR